MYCHMATLIIKYVHYLFIICYIYDLSLVLFGIFVSFIENSVKHQPQSLMYNNFDRRYDVFRARIVFINNLSVASNLIIKEFPYIRYI